MKHYLFFIVVAIIFVLFVLLGCSKAKCESCETVTSGYTNGTLTSKTVIPAACGTKPGTTTSHLTGDYNKQYTFITTTTCK